MQTACVWNLQCTATEARKLAEAMPGAHVRRNMYGPPRRPTVIKCEPNDWSLVDDYLNQGDWKDEPSA